MITALADNADLFDPAKDVTNMLAAAVTFASHIATPVILLAAIIQASYLLINGQLTAARLARTALMAVMTIVFFNMTPTLVSLMRATTGPDPAGATTAPKAPAPSPAPPPAHDTTGPAIDWSFLLPTAGALAAAAALIGVIYLATHAITTRRQRRDVAAAARTAQLQRWSIGERAIQETSTQLMDFENNPESVYFTRPLLADVTEPDTAAFYTAFTEARSLHVETAPTDDEQITAFVTAATAAQRAFTVANDNALRKARRGVIHGGRKLTEHETRKLGQARKLLAHALDPANTPELANQAHAKAQDLIDEVGLIIPERLTATTMRSIEALHTIALSATAAGS